MQIREHMKDSLGIAEPENYLVINFASDSIKKDAKIIQAVYRYKGENTVRYVQGGQPELNQEFTNISLGVYADEALSPEKVEDEIVDLLQSEKVKYIVYNNVVWNTRLIENNKWTRLQQMMSRIPCFAISDYEAVRRAHGDTLFDYSDMSFQKACQVIQGRAKSVPKGSRVSIFYNYQARGIDEEIPRFNTAAEKVTYAMGGIMEDILDHGMNSETYTP